MSHFTVLVVTKEKPTKESIAAALQPFHEFECTGVDDEFIKNVDETASIETDYVEETKEHGRTRYPTLKEFAIDYNGHAPWLASEPLDIANTHKYGWCKFDNEGNVLEVIRRTNQNRKWDWYQIGGRWKGSLETKLGFVDSAMKSDVLPHTLKSIACFAFLQDGKWAERGRMGWWATVSNEKEDWPEQFQKLLSAVPNDHWLTVVDCHI